MSSERIIRDMTEWLLVKEALARQVQCAPMEEKIERAKRYAKFLEENIPAVPQLEDGKTITIPADDERRSS